MVSGSRIPGRFPIAERVARRPRYDIRCVTNTLRNNGLGLAFGGIFLLAPVDQALTGLAEFNSEQVKDGLETISLGNYVLLVARCRYRRELAVRISAVPAVHLATVHLMQRGSPESKKEEEPRRS